jgi:hypothetical protein
MRGLRTFLHHRATNLVMALILIATSLAEVWTSLGGPALSMSFGGTEMRVGAHNGVLAYGVMHLLRALAEFFHDVEQTVEGSPARG